MELLEAIYTMRSMRRLKPDPIPDDAIRAIIDAAIRAPSGSNQQNWAFIIVRDRALKEAIASHYRAGWQRLVETRYRPALEAADTDDGTRMALERLMRSAGYLAEHIAEAPVWIVPCLRVGDGPTTLTSG